MDDINVVLLCGGKGTRLEGLDMPKPMFTVNGKSVLYHVLSNLPDEVTSVKILYNEALDKFQFKGHTVHTCHGLANIEFIKIGIDTRGPVETAYSGLRKIGIPSDKPILFVDNDGINKFSLTDIERNFLGIGTFHTEDRTQPSSFVTLSPDGDVTDIKEKVGISNTYCTGLYYFPSVNVFYDLATKLFEDNPTKSEYFMSDMYAKAIQCERRVRTFTCSDSISLGTRADIAKNIHRVKKYPMRICFDIDNTIITNSIGLGIQTGYEPIPKVIDMIRKLHNEGNTIVLSTARSMKTCDSNAGRAGKRSMLNVLTRLEELNVPYDEIYFGKPWADLYVDDRAWNQYTNPNFPEFMFNYKSEDASVIPVNSANKENTLSYKNGVMKKEGPQSSLEGEIYYYKTVQNTKIESFFPKYYKTDVSGIYRYVYSIEMEIIDGITPSKIFRNNLMTRTLLTSIYNRLSELHQTDFDDGSVLSSKDVFDNYIVKLNSRLKSSPEAYELPRINEVMTILTNVITEYTSSQSFKVNVIHGDPWFDNIIIAKNGDIKFIDMRGKVSSTFSIKGDIMTDYAKLYQSILGFDFYVNNEAYHPDYEAQCRKWFADVLPISINDPVLEAVTACIILRTFYYFPDRTRIPNIYNSLGKLNLFSFLTC